MIGYFIGNVRIFKYSDNHKAIFIKKYFVESAVRYIHFHDFQDNLGIVSTMGGDVFAINIDDSENFNDQMIKIYSNGYTITNIRTA